MKTDTLDVLVDVTAAVIVHRGRVLIARRHDHVHLGGLWEFPGGKCEPGETLAASLRREIREELGIDLAHVRRWREVTHAYPERTVRLFFYRCSVSDAQVRAAHPHDSQEIRWADAADLDTLEFPAADHAVLAALRRMLSRAEARA